MSNFGDIYEPSTRTAWEDWDDVLFTETFPERLSLQTPLHLPKEIRTFLLLEGRYLYNYVQAQSEHLELVNSIPEVNLLLYRTKANNTYICTLKDYNLVQSSEIVELIKDYINMSVDVITIVMKPLSEYQISQFITKDYVIKCLVTSKQKSKCISSISDLEQPNMIAGVTAGALCWREIIDKPATALVCYVDQPEEQNICELQDLFKKFDMSPLMKTVKKSNVLNSNLYI